MTTKAPPPRPRKPKLADAEARHRIEHDLDHTFFVEAAAGTGKTTALVSRMMAALRTGHTTLERMVALTFTEKAAGEMKLRLREEIEKLRASCSATGCGSRCRWRRCRVSRRSRPRSG